MQLNAPLLENKNKILVLKQEQLLSGSANYYIK